MGNVGLQFWSINEAAGKDLLGTIEKVAAMGYSGAQFAGFGDHTAEEVKAKMDEVGIKAAGAHVQLELLENELEETLKFHETIENDLIIVPFLGEERRTTAEDYEKIAVILSDIGEKLHARGFTLAYHNHDFEFDVFNGKTGFEIIFGNTDPNHVKMELDCYWAAYAGHDPLEVIKEYADRVVSLHIKDKRVEGDQQVSTELGTGTLPLDDYVNKGKEVGAKWFVVEQEYFTKDPLESAAENAKVLNNIVSGN
jgi:sugar phosphate isomerase/epimerase